MRRLFVILMLCLLSLQSAWAVTDICEDIGSPQQSAAQQLSGSDEPQSSDCFCCAQCTSCHVLAVAPGLSLGVPLRHPPVLQLGHGAGPAPLSSTDPARPERPKWLAC